MKYCVAKGTIKCIDGSENHYDLMLQNAISAGYTEHEIEILTEEQWQARLIAMQPLPEPTLEQKNRADIDYLAIMLGVIL